LPSRLVKKIVIIFRRRNYLKKILDKKNGGAIIGVLTYDESNFHTVKTRMAGIKQKTFYNRSLERALQILGVFNAERQILTLGQITEIIKLPMPTVLRLCRTLIDYDYLSYDEKTKQYSLGLKLFELGSVVFSRFSLRKIATQYLIYLQTKLERTAFLGILMNDYLVYIDKREDQKYHILFASNIGTRRPPYFGMLGQVLMAFLPDKEISRLLRDHPLVELTENTITDEAEFKKKLKKIRKDGYCIDQEEAIHGISGISAPVFDYTGRVVAALGIGFMSSTENEDGRRLIIDELVKVAREVSGELGYFGYAVKDTHTAAGITSRRPMGVV
jgi:IclR family transcriptional regulator, KDG regulon repressor